MVRFQRHKREKNRAKVAIVVILIVAVSLMALPYMMTWYIGIRTPTNQPPRLTFLIEVVDNDGVLDGEITILGGGGNVEVEHWNSADQVPTPLNFVVTFWYEDGGERYYYDFNGGWNTEIMGLNHHLRELPTTEMYYADAPSGVMIHGELLVYGATANDLVLMVIYQMYAVV